MVLTRRPILARQDSGDTSQGQPCMVNLSSLLNRSSKVTYSGLTPVPMWPKARE